MKMKDKNAEQREKRKKHLERLQASKQNNRRKEPSLNRKRATLIPRKVILIACEGKNTEPSYFRQFKVKSVDIEPIGDGYSHLSLVDWATKKASHKKYDEIWVVFDADPKPDNPYWKQNFNQAIWKAQGLNYKVGYSHQAFEYWLILHFEAHQGGSMPRTDYDEKINGYINPLGSTYDGKGDKKVTKDFFDLLMGIEPDTGKRRVEIAMCRAKTIFDRLPHINFADEESSTSVFLLVKELLDMDIAKSKRVALEDICN